MKPLGHKSYGSIPHLPGSKTGPADHTLNPGQTRIATTRVPGRKDTITITEKLDGSNVAVAKHEGQILALGRAGYLAQSSPHTQHQLFAAWVRERTELFDQLLDEGERVCGEWLALAHGTRYTVDSNTVFAAFDLMRGQQRAPFEEFWMRFWNQLATVPVLYRGIPLSIEEALLMLPREGYYNAEDIAEGLVYRVETEGQFNFMAKYVRPQFETGRYLFTEGREVWNWRP